IETLLDRSQKLRVEGFLLQTQEFVTTGIADAHSLPPCQWLSSASITGVPFGKMVGAMSSGTQYCSLRPTVNDLGMTPTTRRRIPSNSALLPTAAESAANRSRQSGSLSRTTCGPPGSPSVESNRRPNTGRTPKTEKYECVTQSPVTRIAPSGKVRTARVSSYAAARSVRSEERRVGKEWRGGW